MSQTGGGQPPPGRTLQYVRRVLKLPYSDLSLTDKSDLPIPLADHFDLGIVLPYGIGPNEPRLLAVDDAGRVLVATAAGAPPQVAIQNDPATNNAIAQVFTASDALTSAAGLGVHSTGRLWNGATFDRARSASAAVLAAQSGLGATEIAPVGEWAVMSAPAAGLQASASRAAGAAGVRHIGRRLSFGFSSSAALAGVSTVTFNLRDGATGAGTILKSWTFDLPAAVIAPFAFGIEVSAVGTAATAMTLETAAAVAGLRVFVNLAGYDAA